MAGSPETDFDIIVAGGGVGGCVVAGRLAASDPKLKILILESGPDVKEDILHVQPARFMHHQRADSNTMRFVHSYPDPNLNGRSIQVATAQCFGGGSSVNFSFYARASASDYDDWERVHGNSGWGFKDLLPLFRKTETYQINPNNKDESVHGYSGPLNVSYGGAFTNIGKEYLEVVAKYDKSRTIVEDGNDFHTVDSFSRWPKWIDANTGRRSDVAHYYIYNTQQHNSNLSYLTSSPVVRVMLKGKRATGVEYLHKGQTCIANASRLVVVSGGTFGSPAILERSGIGKLDILKKAGIQPVLDLPGIGENFQDHPTAFVSFLASPESQTLEGIINNDPEEIKKWDAEWRINGSGLMASNGIEAGIKIRPHPDDLQVLGPAFEKQWKEFYSKYPDKPVVSFGIVSLATLEPEQINPSQKHFRFGYFPLHATSSGSTHITSPTSPSAPPDFRIGFLSTGEDLALLKWSYKKCREWARRMSCYRGEYLPHHPTFPEGSAATCVGARSGPVPIDAADIVYDEEDEKAIEEYTRNILGTGWHSLGTCSMKARDLGGVVDSKLNVYGLEGLKVADMSICPSNVGANTYSTALVIGEKAAEIILDELKLQSTL